MHPPHRWASHRGRLSRALRSAGSRAEGRTARHRGWETPARTSHGGRGPRCLSIRGWSKRWGRPAHDGAQKLRNGTERRGAAGDGGADPRARRRPEGPPEPERGGGGARRCRGSRGHLGLRRSSSAPGTHISSSGASKPEPDGGGAAGARSGARAGQEVGGHDPGDDVVRPVPPGGTPTPARSTAARTGSAWLGADQGR